MIKTNIKTRIIIALSLVFTIMLIVAGFQLIQMNSIMMDSQLIYEHPYKVSNTTEDIKTEMFKTAILSRYITLTYSKHELDSIKKEINNSGEFISNDFKTLHAKYLGNSKDVDSLSGEYSAWKSIQNRFYRLKSENKTDSIEYLIKYNARFKFDRCIYYLNLICNFANSKADNTIGRINKSDKDTFHFAAGFLLISAMLVLFFIVYLSKSITKPIKIFFKEANEIMHHLQKPGSKVFHNEELLLLTLAELKKAYRSIEQQANDIDLYNKRLTELNNELENRVVQRTSELLSTNDKLNISEKLYRNLFNNMLNGFAYCKMEFDGEVPLDFTYLSVNEAFETLTGLKNVTGLKVSDVIPGIRKSDPVLFDIYGRVALNGNPEVIEIYVEALKMWFSISVYSPEKEYFVAVFDVITERKKTLLALEHSNKELEQFAYVASHDLQEPLRMVSSYTQLLAKRYRDRIDSDAIEFIDYAVSGATRMQGLINDLLEYSRLNTRKKPPVLTDCNSLLGKVRMNLSILLNEKNGLITNEELPCITADETQLMQLFQNLISNGIKYNISVSPHVHISATEEKSDWIFSIKDNGIGIEKEFYERIFGIFQRLHSRDEYSGTGIGLAICRRIVDRHGGRIWLESEIDKGTVFYFSIPK